MDDLTKTTLKPRLDELIKAKASVQKSRDALTDQESEYCAHHRKIISTYSEMITLLNWAIYHSPASQENNNDQV